MNFMLILCLIFNEPSILSIAAAPFYIPTSKLWEFQFHHMITNTCYFVIFIFVIFIIVLIVISFFIIVVLVSMKWYWEIFISIITNDVKHLFKCLLLDICISFLEKFCVCILNRPYGWWILLGAFAASVIIIMWFFFLHFVNVMYYVDRFSYVDSLL